MIVTTVTGRNDENLCDKLYDSVLKLCKMVCSNVKYLSSNCYQISNSFFKKQIDETKKMGEIEHTWISIGKNISWINLKMLTFFQTKMLNFDELLNCVRLDLYSSARK